MSLPPILVSRTSHQYGLDCDRRWWWLIGAPNGTKVGGWEKRTLALPLATGSYVHLGIESVLRGGELDAAVQAAIDAYKVEVEARGLDAEQGADIAHTIAEQSALIEALIRAWVRVRLPKILNEYDIVDVEREEYVELTSPDSKGDVSSLGTLVYQAVPAVGLMARADAVVRRKLDSRLFLLNWRTVSEAGDKWYRGFETDIQTLTEVLAVEARLGEKLGGVIVEGLIKGKRYRDKDRDGNTVGWHQGSPLIYGYKFDGNPPLEPASYDFNYTRRKGWHRFPVWGEAFTTDVVAPSPVAHWGWWLPYETVEAQFALVPPIIRQPGLVESAATQIVAASRRREEARQTCVGNPKLLDVYFPQNTRACHWPSKCPAYSLCWEGGVSDDPEGSKLYRPRQPHHPREKEKP